MTQPTQRVLYLPPGVVAAPPPTPVPQSQSGLPFDRAFFEQLLPAMVANFCAQIECAAPLVEVMTVAATGVVPEGFLPGRSVGSATRR